ncbi:MAG: DnaA regulatory inactivator Hda [Gammaproteobacteria bacterium]|nr:DnaA regulatory inactivator Hda [Gammaproteobacteria bacterium]
MQQLPLQLQPKESCTFSSFFSGSNQLAVDILQDIFSGGGEQQVFLWSAEGLGKSHLLQAACKMASSHGLTASYLPLDEMPGVTTDILQGVEHLDLVAIDGLDAVLGDLDWELALFALINQSRESAVSLVFAAEKNPAELEMILPDLRSRLTWGPVFQLKSLSDDEKLSALQSRAATRGLELPDNVANYLLENYPRDLFVLFDNMDKLDQASLVQQRRLTIPFIRQVLNSEA